MTDEAHISDGSQQQDRVAAMIDWLTKRAEEIRSQAKGSVEFHFNGADLTMALRQYERCKTKRNS